MQRPVSWAVSYTHLDVYKRQALDSYNAKREIAGDEVFSQFERNILLQIMDTQWREHLSNLDLLRQGIHLRGYAQKNPKQEYKLSLIHI